MNPKTILESGLPRLLATAVCGCLLTAIPAAAQISLVRTGSLNNQSNLTNYTLSFDASNGGSSVDKLIVSAGTETQSRPTMRPMCHSTRTWWPLSANR